MECQSWAYKEAQKHSCLLGNREEPGLDRYVRQLELQTLGVRGDIHRTQSQSQKSEYPWHKEHCQ